MKDFFEFFYPEHAQAKYLRKMVSAQQSQAKAVASGLDEMANLKKDIRFLTLILATILKRMEETKTMSLADVQDLANKIDPQDGCADHGLEPGVLRGLLGLIQQESEKKTPSNHEFAKELAEVTRRYRV
jgi:hypothetical protein